MALITRTIYGAELQVCMFHGIPYPIRPNSTLNEQLNIRPTDVPAAGVYPTQRYLVVGNRGHGIGAGADGYPYINDLEHSVSDSGLFGLVPLVVREQANDLSAAERAKYALRTSETLDGKLCFVYYARRLDLTNVTSQLRKVSVVDGIETVVPFVPNNSNQNPTPPVIVPNQATPALADGDYLDVSMLITAVFTPADVQEYINACVMKFGSDKYAAISEIGLVTAVDKIIQAEAAGGGTFQFNEIIAAQIATHVVNYNHMASNTDGATFTFEAGANEPMLTESTQGLTVGTIAP